MAQDNKNFEAIWKEIAITADITGRLRLLCSLYLEDFTNHSLREFRFFEAFRKIKEEYKRIRDRLETAQTEKIDKFLEIYDKWQSYRMMKGHFEKYPWELEDKDWEYAKKWLAIKDKGYEEEFKNACESFLKHKR